MDKIDKVIKESIDMVKEFAEFMESKPRNPKYQNNYE